VGGCYSVGAVGSGVRREARGGACVMYKEEVTDRTKEPTRVREAPAGCTTNGDNNCQTCDVTINGKTYCSQCAAGYVPIDGTCIQFGESSVTTTAGCKKNDDNSVDAQSTTCEKCTQTGYFLYKGGCYAQATTPGSTICTEQTAAGVCATCSNANGYFKNPEAANNVDSCVSCGDTTGVTIGNTNTKTYKGVTNCAKCDAPESLQTSGTAVATCTECNANLYLKTVTGSSTETSCVTAETCNTGYFPNDNAGGKKKCLPCSDNNNGGIENCGECSLLPSASRAATPLITCTKCTGKKLSPLRDACLDGCPAGTYDSSNVCTPCHTSCAECNGNANQDSCTACYPGSVLNKTDSLNTDTCIPECTGRYAENCEAGMCTAVLGGSKYCSRCAAGYAPIDGMCTKVATTSRDTSGCTASDGVCTACTGTNYALLSGGCYNTKALPGSAMCTAVTGSNGQCSACANGQTYANNNCPACAEGCSACNAGQTQQCTKCLAGYYLSNSKCFKCTADSNEGSNAITGVPNCVSCAAPTGSSGPVTCYVTQEPSVNPTDPSVNKTGLSSGAIAGISVAVIVVVGGLVGFLCWWFICRGKA
ncbi:Variant-specific surface protein, partial [Giardia duodenalis]